MFDDFANEINNLPPREKNIYKKKHKADSNWMRSQYEDYVDIYYSPEPVHSLDRQEAQRDELLSEYDPAVIEEILK